MRRDKQAELEDFYMAVMALRRFGCRVVRSGQRHSVTLPFDGKNARVELVLLASELKDLARPGLTADGLKDLSRRIMAKAR